jgi:hypothetical protein
MAGAYNSWPRCKLSNRSRVERALCRSAFTIALRIEVGAAERGTIVRSSVCCMSGIQCEVFMFIAMRPRAVCTAESGWIQDSASFSIIPGQVGESECRPIQKFAPPPCRRSCRDFGSRKIPRKRMSRLWCLVGAVPLDEPPTKSAKGSGSKRPYLSAARLPIPRRQEVEE